MKQTRLGKRIAAWFLCLAMVLTTVNLPAFVNEAHAASDFSFCLKYNDKKSGDIEGGTIVKLAPLLSSLGIGEDITDAVSSAPTYFQVEKIGGVWFISALRWSNTNMTLTVTVDGVQEPYEVTVKPNMPNSMG